MKVLGIGESVIDNACIMNSSHVEKHIGGPSLIALIVLSRLGIDSHLLTTLGRDEDGAIIKKTVKHEGVKMFAKVQKKTKINTYVINPLDGSRRKIRGETIHPYIRHIDRDFIRQFDLIIIDRHEKEAFYEILEKKKLTTKIIIDPSTEISEYTLDMIKYADYPIIPIESLIKMGNSRDLSRCLQKLHTITEKSVIITAGELGSIIYDGTQLELIPTLMVKAVDVQGAGDIYRGAFAYGVLLGWDLQTNVSFANKVAALQCTKLGNAAAIPKRNEIELLNRLYVAEKPITFPIVSDYFAKLYQTL